jgi:hypothetical protein
MKEQATKSENYAGSIQLTVAHEVAHAFDIDKARISETKGFAQAFMKDQQRALAALNSGDLVGKEVIKGYLHYFESTQEGFAAGLARMMMPEAVSVSEFNNFSYLFQDSMKYTVEQVGFLGIISPSLLPEAPSRVPPGAIPYPNVPGRWYIPREN